MPGFLLTLVLMQAVSCVGSYFALLDLLQNGLAWEDAWTLPGYALVLLLLGSPVLGAIHAYNGPVKEGAKWAIGLCIAGMIVAWIALPNTKSSWAALLCFLPGLYISWEHGRYLPKNSSAHPEG